MSLAQEPWPNARISVIVGFGAGGFADTVGRVISKELADRLKQSVVVQNMPGAGGNTAGRQVSIAAADGYTLLITTTALAINETLYKNKGFASGALTPIAIPVTAPESLSSNAKGDLKSFKDLERVASQGRLFVGSAGIGSGSHIASEYFFKVRAKLKFTHIPFQGGNNALHAMLTGDINVARHNRGGSDEPGDHARRNHRSGDCEPRARCRDPDGADVRGTGISGIRGQLLGRIFRAGRHAQRDPRTAQ